MFIVTSQLQQASRLSYLKMRLASAVIPVLLALPALSAPAIEESCLKIYYRCLDTARSLSPEQFHAAPFSVSKECTLAATCFPSSPDELLKAINDVIFSSSGGPPKSVNSPRLPQALYNALAAPGQTANQQSFVDAYLSVSPTQVTPDIPIFLWKRIAQWTGFCSGDKAIPYQNLADWFQYSTTVSVPPGPCGDDSSSTVITSSLPSSTSSSAPPTTTTSVPGEASCARIYSICVGNARSIGEAAWRPAPFEVSKTCILAATCYPGGPNAFLAGIQRDAFPGSIRRPPEAQSVDRFPQSSYSIFSSPGNIAGQQSYIDSYYSLLSALGGPYPVNTVVIGYWEAISAWTGFCSSRNVPYQNLADWFQWSSVVEAPRTC